MFRSLSRLASLPGHTRVCCGHEYTKDNLRFAWSVEPDNPALAERIRRVWRVREHGGCAVPSTIAEERATNPFLRTESPSLRAHVEAAAGQSLTDSAAVFAATRALKDRKVYRELTDALLPIG
jgi:hydroxyacylglutathione hydrolase